MSHSIYLWLIRPVQTQDTVFMNDFASFLQKNNTKFQNLVLHLSTEDTPEQIYFQAKRISGFLSEHLVTNTVFHLHQWGLLSRQGNDYVLNTEKLSKILTLSSTVVLTNVWQESLLNISQILKAVQSLPVQKAFVFANNPHLNIHTQDYVQASVFPDEETTADLLYHMTPLLETWISHLNNLSKIL